MDVVESTAQAIGEDVPPPSGGPYGAGHGPEAGGAVKQSKLPPIDTRGKTRAQIKAEEYERNCGALWRTYQTCLQVCDVSAFSC